MADDQNVQEPEVEAGEFGKGYWLFFGAMGGLFLTVVIAVVVMIVAAPDQDVIAGGGTETTIPVVGGDAANGEDLYAGTCVACHGQEAEGVPGLGPALVGNEFVAGLSDEELTAFLEVGRPSDDPDNESGVTMPPKGGNPSLTDSDMADLTAYLREIG